jgi:hypothetical protein
MTNFATALGKGLTQATRQAGEIVSYRRGSTTAQLTAMRGVKQTDDADTAQRSTVQVIRHDWIATADQIVLPGGTIQPIEGDEIIDAAGVRYQVTKSPLDGKCSRIMPHNVGLRIHTIIVEGEK